MPKFSSPANWLNLFRIVCLHEKYFYVNSFNEIKFNSKFSFRADHNYTVLIRLIFHFLGQNESLHVYRTVKVVFRYTEVGKLESQRLTKRQEMV